MEVGDLQVLVGVIIVTVCFAFWYVFPFLNLHFHFERNSCLERYLFPSALKFVEVDLAAVLCTE